MCGKGEVGGVLFEPAYQIAGSITHEVGAALLICSIVGMAYACVATLACLAFSRRRPFNATAFPSIALFKPLHGDEPGLYENLKSYCVQDYPGAVQIVFGVQDPADAAIGVVEALRLDYPHVDIRLVIDQARHGTNRKISNLINMADRASADIVVISDSDVRVGSDHLRKIVGALEQPGVGLVTCLYRGRPTGSRWSSLAAMDIDYRFSLGVVMGVTLGIAHPCLGPTMALRRTTLEAVGGFRYLSNFLADDYELGRAVRGLGHKMIFAPDLIDHLCPEQSLREMLTHEFRWARTVRMIEPVGYFGSVITHFWVLALIGAPFLGGVGWALFGLATLVRLMLIALLGPNMATPPNLLWAPLRDLLSFAVFVAAFFSDRVVWRGAQLKLERTGEITTFLSR